MVRDPDFDEMEETDSGSDDEPAPKVSSTEARPRHDQSAIVIPVNGIRC